MVVWCIAIIDLSFFGFDFREGIKWKRKWEFGLRSLKSVVDFSPFGFDIKSINLRQLEF